MIITILIFLLILSVLVLVHEFGHFLVAKKLGIKVEEFGFGLPPRVVGIKRGETTYSINWLPIGGFVKLYGEDEAGAGKIKVKSDVSEIKDTKRAFFAKPAHQRALVVIAGVLMNTLLAAIIFYAFLFISNFKTDLPLLGDHKFFFVSQQNQPGVVIDAVVPNSPAEKAGIRPPSKIISVNGEKVTTSFQFVSIVNKNKGKRVVLAGQNLSTNKNFTVTMVPRVSPPKNQGALGVSFFPQTTAFLSYNTPTQKIFSGFIHPANLLVYSFDILGKLIEISFQQKTVAPIGEGVSGPVGIYSIVDTINQIPDLKEKLLQYFNLAGLLSISLAFFNVLPFPALDGGRLFFILIEMTTRKKVNPTFERYAHTIGMIILLALILVITFHDLFRIFK